MSSTGARAAWRLLLVAGLLLLVAFVSASPAAAHTRTQETTNLDSRITRDPGLPGVHWRIYTGGLLVEVVNEGDGVLVVSGYEGEPYLRIGPDGVERNRRSPATYLNDERIGRRIGARTDVAMPRDVDAKAAPEWIRISAEPMARWHDHRVHWMSPQPPGFVEAGPLSRTLMAANLVGVIGRAGDDAGVFRSWDIALTYDGTPAVLAGEMAWDDPPPAWPWLVAAALLVLPALAGLRKRDPAAVVRPAAVVVLLVAGANAIHLVDDLVAWPGPLLDDLSGLLHTGLFLTVGVGASLWALRTDYGRVLAVAIASGAVLYHQGLVHLPILQASHFPSVWPDPLVRLTVAAGLLQALAVAAVIVRARRAGSPAPGGADRMPSDQRPSGRAPSDQARRLAGT